VLLLLVNDETIGATAAFVMGTVILIAYRFAKEVKNTWLTSG
jgi:hypothetical protein